METSGWAEQQTLWLVLLGSCSVFGELPYEEEERQIIFLIIRTLWYRKLFCHSVSHWWRISRSSWLFTPSVPWHRISCVTPISCDFQAPRSCSVMLSPAPGPYMWPGHPKVELHKEADSPQGAICTSQRSRGVTAAIRVIYILSTISFVCLSCNLWLLSPAWITILVWVLKAGGLEPLLKCVS